MKKILLTIFMLSFITFFGSVTVHAQSNLCQFLPCPEYTDPVTEERVNDNVGGLIRFGLSTVFVLIIIYGIYLIIIGALKIIRSDGDPAKIEEGQKVIRGVIIGIGIIFIGIIGLVIVIRFFQAGEITNVNTELPPGTNLPVIN